jgi:hypothetical protein
MLKSYLSQQNNGEAFSIWFILLVTTWKAVLKAESWKSRLEEKLYTPEAELIKTQSGGNSLTSCSYSLLEIEIPSQPL